MSPPRKRGGHGALSPPITCHPRESGGPWPPPPPPHVTPAKAGTHGPLYPHHISPPQKRGPRRSPPPPHVTPAKAGAHGAFQEQPQTLGAHGMAAKERSRGRRPGGPHRGSGIRNRR